MRKRWIGLTAVGVAAAVLQATPASAAGPSGLPTQNWTGYAVFVKNKTMGAASGTFTVPKLGCNDFSSVGWFTVTGGLTGPNEAGVGVGATCSIVNGKQLAVYNLYALWHGGVLSQGPAVKAGHVINTKVVVTGNKYVLTGNDTTSKAHRTWTKNCSKNCDHSSAGWVTVIGEGDAFASDSGTLASFTDPKWRALSAKATGAKSAFAPLHFAPIEPLWIENASGQPLAYVGNMTAKGSFPTFFVPQE